MGAGMAGGFLARALAQAGWKTAIIERVHVGGTCVNEGCSPTKTMIANARVAYLAQRGADYGVVHTGLITIDMSNIYNRLIPYTIFIDPQLGRVGLSEAEARAQGRPI